jgi:hypothetical protein
MEKREMTIAEALKLHNAGLMRMEGVAGTGVGMWDGEPCIKVFAEKVTPELLSQVPGQIEGYPVKIEETGTFRAL